MVAVKAGIIGIAVTIGVSIVITFMSAGPSFVPPESPTSLVPPWFAFNIGCKLHEFFSFLAFATQPPDAYIIDLSTSYWNSEVAYALTKNKILDRVEKETASGGTVSCEKVAEKLELQAFVVCRYMETGMHLHLLEKDADAKGYSLTPHGALLTDSGYLRDFMLMINEETKDAWRAVTTDLMKDGPKPKRNNGFEIAYGTDIWTFFSKNPVAETLFDGAMKALNPGPTGAMIMDWEPPSEDANICDIGGGMGSLLGEILLHYPKMTGIVFDRPEVIKRSQEHLKAVGLADRAKAIGGNFFDDFPNELADCDAFILRFIIHDWDDDSNAVILRNIRNVAKKSKKDAKPVVVIMDQIIDTGAASFFEKAKSQMAINMISVCPYGARERSVEEHSNLFDAAGYENVNMKHIPLRTIQSLVEVEIV